MTMLSGRVLALILAGALGLGACDSFPLATNSISRSAAPQTASQVRPAPRLQAGDKAKIVVFGEDKLTGEHDIDPSGRIAVPLIGSIHAAGMTAKELERAIEGRLKSAQILRAPEVTVSISTFRPFYVLGEVEKPGEYKYQNSLNVMSAAAVAGGFTYRASKSRILIQRAGEKGFTEYQLTPDVPVYPGDLISVPERYF